MFVWMRHEKHGGKAQIAAAAVDTWRNLGWKECDPPTEPDLLHDPIVEPKPAMNRRVASDG